MTRHLTVDVWPLARWPGDQIGVGWRTACGRIRGQLGVTTQRDTMGPDYDCVGCRVNADGALDLGEGAAALRRLLVLAGAI